MNSIKILNPLQNHDETLLLEIYFCSHNTSHRLNRYNQIQHAHIHTFTHVMNQISFLLPYSHNHLFLKLKQMMFLVGLGLVQNEGLENCTFRDVSVEENNELTLWTHLKLRKKNCNWFWFWYWYVVQWSVNNKHQTYKLQHK